MNRLMAWCVPDHAFIHFGATDYKSFVWGLLWRSYDGDGFIPW